MVTVHHFKVFDFNRGNFIIQPLKSTVERINQIPTAEIIPDTAEEIQPSALDSEGRYNPQQSPE